VDSRERSVDFVAVAREALVDAFEDDDHEEEGGGH